MQVHLVGVLVALLSSIASTGRLVTFSGSDYADFCLKYGRTHRDGFVDGVEHSIRQQRFEENMKRVEAHNLDATSTWVAGVNKLMDYTDAEFKAMLGLRRGSNHRVETPPSLVQTEQSRVLAESFDWEPRLSSVKNLVRDQGQCGSCWAVAAAGALEMHLEIAGWPAQKLSHEQLVDCVQNPNRCGGNGGCDGATPQLAFEYVQSRGIMHAEGYGGAGSSSSALCANSTSTVSITTFATLPKNNLHRLLEAVSTIGPAVVAAAATDWSLYLSGVFNDCKRDARVDHAIVLVGYGSDATFGKYWRIRNSWGSDWGENGFMRLLRHDTDEGESGWCGIDHDNQAGVGCEKDPKEVPVCGMCGILLDSAYPIGVKLSADVHM